MSKSKMAYINSEKLIEHDFIDQKAKRDHRLAIIICWMMIGLFVINAAFVLETLTGLPSDLVSLGVKVVLLGLIVFNIRNIIRGAKSLLVLTILFGAVIILLNLLLASDNAFFQPTIEGFLLNVFPVFVVMMCMDNSDILLNMLTKVSWILVVLSVVVLLLARGINGTYSMGFSNSLVLPVVLIIHDYYLTKKGYKLFLSILGILVMIALGSRGALLGVGVYAIVTLCRGLFTKAQRIRSVILIMIILLGLFFYKDIVKIAMDLLDKMGIYSRTLYLLLYDQSHDSGRNVIYQSMIDEIQRHPFYMRGIAGEYAITNGFYAHNFVLELLCDFGIVFGGIVVLFIFWKIIKTLYGSIFNRDPDLCMIFMAASIPIMFVSGSLWTTTYFWLWIALAVKNKNMKFTRAQI